MKVTYASPSAATSVSLTAGRDGIKSFETFSFLYPRTSGAKELNPHKYTQRCNKLRTLCNHITIAPSKYIWTSLCSFIFKSLFNLLHKVHLYFIIKHENCIYVLMMLKCHLNKFFLF